MPNTVITSVEQATPEWLTAALSTSGALSAGTVIAVDLDAGHGNWSNNARLRPRYSADAAGDRPLSLFLKMVRTDLDDEESFSDSEVRYYTRDYLDVPDAPLVRCHDAAYSSTTRATTCCSTTSSPPMSRRPTAHPPWGTRSRWPTGSRRCTPAGGAPTG